MAMNTAVIIAIISAVASVIVAAITFYRTKKKERDADWRKYKYEQHKEFVAALSGNVGPNPIPENRQNLLRACNTLNLIGSRGILESLQSLIASFNSG